MKYMHFWGETGWYMRSKLSQNWFEITFEFRKKKITQRNSSVTSNQIWEYFESMYCHRILYSSVLSYLKAFLNQRWAPRRTQKIKPPQWVWCIRAACVIFSYFFFALRLPHNVKEAAVYNDRSVFSFEYLYVFNFTEIPIDFGGRSAENCRF